MSLFEDLLDISTSMLGFLPLRMFNEDVRNVVDYPFIDEIFHINQAQQYCRGNWNYWDPKITTPPGLYYLAALYDDLVSGTCDLGSLRLLNFIGGIALAFLTFTLRRKIQNPGFSTFSIFMSPLITLYYSLFYTDVWSAVFVLAGYTVATIRPFKKDIYNAIASALFGLVSITFRQTNIVWTAFSMVALFDSIAQEQHLYTGDFHSDMKALVNLALRNWKLLAPYVIDAALFGTFVYENEGITLGDKANHQITFHLMQLFYCVVFIVGFTFPLWFSFSLIKDYFKDNFSTKKGLMFNAIFIPFIGLAIKNFTVIHQFVLSDNRHYVFYLIRRFLLRSQSAKYELIPVYHFAFYVVWKFMKQCFSSRSSSNSSLAMFFALLCAASLTIIPSPLVEPRYYILPFIFFRLLINPSFEPLIDFHWFREHNYAIRLVLEGIWIWMWTQALYVIFIEYTFPWDNEPHMQRIIW